MTTALAASRSLEEVAREKIGLLTEALTTLHGRGFEFDPQTISGIVGHVIATREMDRTSPRSVAIAQAVVMISLNFALDFVAESKKSPDKQALAIALLSKNPVATLYAIAEKHFTEIDLAGRAEKLRKMSVLAIREPASPTRLYDLLEEGRYQLLAKWVRGELSDFPGLPLSTKAEEDAIVAEMEAIEAELKLARKVNWKEILSATQNLTKFSASVFQRKEPEVYSPSGSIWQAFLLSLMAKALGEGWKELSVSPTARAAYGVELYVYSDTATVARFIAMLLLEPERIDEEAAIEVAVKVSRVAFETKNGIFNTPCLEQEIHSVLELAGQRIRAFVREATLHYTAVDVEKPTDREVDQFSRTRLFVYVSGNQDRRTAHAQAELGKPWEDARESKNLDKLARAVAGFASWPKVERTRFAETVDFGRFFATIENESATGEVAGRILANLAEAENGQETIAKLVERMKPTHRATLIRLLGRDAGFCKDQEATLRTIVARGNWTFETLRTFVWTTGFNYSGDVAIQTVAATLDEAAWKILIDNARRHCQIAVRRVWEGMTTEMRSSNLMFFNGFEVGDLFLNSTPAAMREVLEPVLQQASQSTQGWKGFEDWRNRPGYRLVFGERSEVRGGFTDTFLDLLDKYRPRP